MFLAPFVPVTLRLGAGSRRVEPNVVHREVAPTPRARHTRKRESILRYIPTEVVGGGGGACGSIRVVLMRAVPRADIFLAQRPTRVSVSRRRKIPFMLTTRRTIKATRELNRPRLLSLELNLRSHAVSCVRMRGMVRKDVISNSSTGLRCSGFVLGGAFPGSLSEEFRGRELSRRRISK